MAEPIDGYRFHDAYREHIVLRDGTRVSLRLLCPEDAPLLLDGLAHLSEDSRYSRFFEVRSRLTSREVEYFTHPDGNSHVAIAAVTGSPAGGERGVGVARFIRMRDRPRTADVAVTVIDDMQRKGLGTALMKRLVEAARERGVERLHFDILATNKPMLSLLHNLAPGVHEAVEAGVTTAEISLVER